jgi:hypothetical protein
VNGQKTTETDRYRIVHLRLAGRTVGEIKRATGWSRTTVTNILDAADVPRHRVLSDDERATIVRLYGECGRIRAVAAATNRAYGTVRNVLLAAGVPIGQQGVRASHRAAAS